MTFSRILTVAALFPAALLILAATAPPAKLSDFTLNDYTGKSWALQDLKESAAVVLVIHGVGCPIVRQSIPEIEKLQKKYSDAKVRFLWLNPNPYDTAADIKEEAESFAVSVPVLMDAKQKVAKELGVERTATAIILVPGDGTILYRGAISDRYGYERQRQHDIHDFLDDALKQHLAGKPIEAPVTTVKGCLVNYLEKNTTP